MPNLVSSQAGVSKNYLAELVDESNQAAAFSLMSLAWQVGWCIAAIAGGYLSHAERAFPSLTDWPLVRDHPYALPFIAVAVPPMLSVVLGYFALQETLRPGTANAKTAAALKEEAPPAGGHFFGWTPNMWKTLRLWCIGVVINNSFQATLPLLVFAPVHAGGLGLGSRAIGGRLRGRRLCSGSRGLIRTCTPWHLAATGLWYGIRALLIIAVELPSESCRRLLHEPDTRLILRTTIVYPRVHRRFGHAVIFRAQISMYPLVFSLIPVISLVRWWRYDPASEAKVDAVTLVLVGILLCLELLGQTIFSESASGTRLSTHAVNLIFSRTCSLARSSVYQCFGRPSPAAKVQWIRRILLKGEPSPALNPGRRHAPLQRQIAGRYAAVPDVRRVVRGVALRILGGEPDSGRVSRLADPVQRIARGRTYGLRPPRGERVEVEGR